MLVYCFRGGKRSKLWVDTLRTIGIQVNTVRGGWKAYRRWVLANLGPLCSTFRYRVIACHARPGHSPQCRSRTDLPLPDPIADYFWFLNTECDRLRCRCVQVMASEA